MTSSRKVCILSSRFPTLKHILSGRLPFDETAARTCGFELGEGANFTVAATSSGLTFVVDFVQMIQINATSWMARSICWKVQVGS